jgi:glucose/mannose-6-phosphate isomerase
VAYMFVAALECAAAARAAPSLREEVELAAALLAELAARWGPEAAPESEAKALAQALAGSVPVVYGAGPADAVARRWKAQINENAKLPAFHSTLPEADHNEILGWEGADSRFSAVFLEDPGVHPRTHRRIELTAQLVKGRATTVERVRALGESSTERVLSLVLLGDLLSIYLAALRGTDPSPMDAIDRLKEELGEHEP